MKDIEFLHAHNYGHKNLGDDAMAINVYRKLSEISDSVYTISTYTEPTGADPAKNVLSVSGMVNNYNIFIMKVWLVLLSKLKPLPVYTVYSFLYCELVYGLAFLNAKFKLPLLLFGKSREMIKVVSRTKNYVRSGSGSLNDIWFWSSMYSQYTEARLVKLYGGNVYFTGQGIGPLTTPYRLKVLKRFSQICDKITLRDLEGSSELMTAVGADSTVWEEVGDDAMDYLQTGAPREFTESISNDNYVICQFRPTDYQKFYGDDYWCELAANLKSLKEENDLQLIAVSFSNGRVNDVHAAERLNAAAGEELVTIVRHVFTPGEGKSIFAGAKMAIGQSYHFGVFALSANVPFIAVYSNSYYKDKMEGLLGWYGMKYSAIRCGHFESMPEVASSILNQGESLVSHLNEVNQDLVKRVNGIFKELDD